MTICFITNKYPSSVEPNVLIFLKQLVDELSKIGIDCVVISPVSLIVNPKYASLPRNSNENGVRVFRPRYFGLGQSTIFHFNPARITTWFFSKAVNKVLHSNGIKPDIVYGHFVTPAGVAAARIGRKYNIPSVLAYGEATYNTINHFGPDRVKKELQSLSGVVAVSKKNMDMISPYVKANITKVFLNGYDPELFHPVNQISSREKYGFPKDAFIVGYVGVFDDLKGIKRLEQAVDSLDDVYFICAGKGTLKPVSTRCLFAGEVLHSDLSIFLACCDVFVLPTRNEGCCNAIIEAVACGKPIVSSKESFNDFILDESNSIRVNSDSISEIATAIMQIKNNPSLLEEMSKGSLKKAQSLTLRERASNIAVYLSDIVEHYNCRQTIFSKG